MQTLPETIENKNVFKPKNVTFNLFLLQARQTLEMEFNNLLQIATERRPENEHLSKS